MSNHDLDETTCLGTVISGSLTRGVEVKLDASVSVEGALRGY